MRKKTKAVAKKPKAVVKKPKTVTKKPKTVAKKPKASKIRRNFLNPKNCAFWETWIL